MFDAPSVVSNIREMQIIWALDDIAYQKIEEELQAIDGDIFIKTARENRVKGMEEELGIVPLSTDTLDDRRFRILTKINDDPPYNQYYIEKKLTALLGEGGYTINIKNKIMTCTLELMNKSNLNAVIDMLEELVSLDIIINVTLFYNKWSRILAAKNTWGNVVQYTWKEIKEDFYELHKTLSNSTAWIR